MVLTAQTGTAGANGTNGTNGVGYDEAIKYGYIAVKLDGTRPDDVPFSDSLVFMFAPASKDFSVYAPDECEPTSTVKRFLLLDNTQVDDYACSITDLYTCDGTYNYFSF